MLTVIDILKFEYLTQLLLDSNYLPLVLKLFAHQDIDKVVESRTDRDEVRWVFFPIDFCHTYSHLTASSLSVTQTAKTPRPQKYQASRTMKVKTKLHRQPSNVIATSLEKTNSQHLLSKKANTPVNARDPSSTNSGTQQPNHPTQTNPSPSSHGATSSPPSTSCA